MPFYDFCCPSCSHTEAHFRKIEQRNIAPYHCAAEMQRVITAPAIRPDISAYISPASGQWVNSRAQRREDLLREGCIENEPGLKAHIAARAASEQEKVMQTVSSTIDQTISELHAAGHIAGD